MGKRNRTRNRRARQAQNKATQGNNNMSTIHKPDVKKAPVQVLTCRTHRMQNIFDFRGGKGTLWAGSFNSVANHIDAGAIEPALVIELLGTNYEFITPWPVEVNATAASNLPPALFEPGPANVPAVIGIDWDDGGTPKGLNVAWWRLLADTIKKTDGDTIILCVGGHGRTGTALAILTALLGVTDSDPVQYVRDRYCDQAVETLAQIKYIELITGIEVTARPSSWLTALSPASIADKVDQYTAPPTLTNAAQTTLERHQETGVYDPRTWKEGTGDVSSTSASPQALLSYDPDGDDDGFGYTGTGDWYDANEPMSELEILRASEDAGLLTRGQ